MKKKTELAFEVSIGGVTKKVVVQEYQRHPVTGDFFTSRYDGCTR
jgi:ribosomal protein L25 (general stress protein Ctc)